MRTKLFFAFLLVIATALFSNLIFERLIMSDFDEYMKGTAEDHLYWVLASIEGSYEGDRWDMNVLSEAVHWGMMLGLDVRVEDSSGREIINSPTVMASLPPAMMRRMESIVHTHSAEGEYEQYPLYSEGKEMGTLFVRPLVRGGAVKVKEHIFKERGRNFLILSFVVAGLSAIVMAVFFSLYLSKPIWRLKMAAGRIAEGDFSIRVEQVSSDEIGRLSESFNYMAEALQKEELVRKHLTSNIAHELRTPLAVTKAQVEAMIDNVVTDIPGGLENIRAEVEKLTRLVEGIEDLAKAEASFFSPGEYARVNLKEFLEGIVSGMRPIFHEKGLRVSLSEKGDLAAVIDVDKLDMIIKNILSNALKFTNAGGVTIEYGSKDSDFYVVVKDTGQGIPKNEIPKIFMRFFKGTGSGDKGAGIGLALVKELVEVMGGKVEVESILGEGTTFTIWLPVKTHAQ
ncbi:MAG TPA: HAMP domain-containing sensor histidine kinase [Thermodesulfovibrionales bacterium]|nr:HAMP domain-containing sensor histidine kinase [Thermodesulfovibrionales bacterium]